MHPALVRTAHRPWPLPATPWMWRQTWHDLLFAHWPVPPSAVRHLIPDWLEIDQHTGSTWVGLIPFRMTGVTLRGVPSLPVLSRFPELNLRLYVVRDGKPGIWFVSLDASHRTAVWAARTFVHLPYSLAGMEVAAEGDRVRYSSVRAKDGGVAFAATYGPAGEPFESRPGSLEHFLTERYCLYTEDRRRGRKLRMEIHHHPWPLQPAQCTFVTNRIAQPQGIELPDTGPRLQFSRRLDVIGWGFETI